MAPQPSRPPHHLRWPLTPSQLEAIDEMFTVLYARLGGSGGSGAAGLTGAFGSPGRDGADGFDGLPGPPGVAGIAGAAGFQGPPGMDGEEGRDGVPGVPGAAGAAGAAGATGATGANGPPGMDGADGEDGFVGPPGATGPTGATGSAGATGPSGVGPPGMDGADGVDGWPPAPPARTQLAASAHLTGSQTLTTDVEASLSFGAVLFDAGGFWAAGSPTRLTAPEPGYYQVGGQITLGTGFAGTAHLRIYKNGTLAATCSAPGADLASGTEAHMVGAVLQLVAGDFVELKVLLSLIAGGTFDITSGSTTTFLQAAKF